MPRAECDDLLWRQAITESWLKRDAAALQHAPARKRGARATGQDAPTLRIVSQVRVVTSSPNVFWISDMNTGPFGVGR